MDEIELRLAARELQAIETITLLVTDADGHREKVRATFRFTGPDPKEAV